MKPEDFYIFCDGGLNHREGLGVEPQLVVGDFDSFDRGALGKVDDHLPEGAPGTFNDHLPGGRAATEVDDHLPGARTSTSLNDHFPSRHPEIITLPTEKDDTDTFFAIKEGLKRGFRDFLLVGVIGNRFDHSLCNISALLYLEKHGAHGVIVDDYSEMEIVGGDKTPLGGANTQNDKTPPDRATSTAGVAFIPDTYSYFSLMNVAGAATGITIKNAKYPLENATIEPEYSYGISNEVLPGKVAEVSVKHGGMLLVKVW